MFRSIDGNKRTVQHRRAGRPAANRDGRSIGHGRISPRLAFWSAWLLCSACIGVWMGMSEPTPEIARAEAPATTETAAEGDSAANGVDVNVAALKSELAATQELVNDLRHALAGTPREAALYPAPGMSAWTVVALTLLAVAGLALTGWSVRSALRERLMPVRNRGAARSRRSASIRPPVPHEFRRGALAWEPCYAADPAGVSQARDFPASRAATASATVRERARSMCVQTRPLSEQARLLRESLVSRENAAAACFALGRVPTFAARGDASGSQEAEDHLSDSAAEDGVNAATQGQSTIDAAPGEGEEAQSPATGEQAGEAVLSAPDQAAPDAASDPAPCKAA